MRAFNRTIALVLCLCVVSLVLVGCASSYTNNPHNNWVLVPKETEKDWGRSAAKRLEKQIGVYGSDTFTRYVDNVGSRVAVYSDRSDLTYQFKILDIFVVNALALPGGYVYLTRGLLREVETESQMAAVLAHEIAHVAAFHSVKRVQLSVVSTLLTLAMAAGGGGRGAHGGMMAGAMVNRGYTRSAESEADRLGLEYMVRAGYDPQGMVQFLRRLNELHGEVPTEDMMILRTHPFLVDRISAVGALRKSRYNDAPTDLILDPARFHRTKRKHLFTPREEVFLSRFYRLADTYEEMDLRAFKQMTSEDFQVGDGDQKGSGAEFFEVIEERFKQARSIDYNQRLLKLDVQEDRAEVVYNFESNVHRKDGRKPKITKGTQMMEWVREDGQWMLHRLR